MIKKYPKIIYSLGLGISIALSTMAMSTLAMEEDTPKYFWTFEMSDKAAIYEHNLKEIREMKLRDTLGITGDDIDLYDIDILALYNLAVKCGRVEEVEQIMTDYEKRYMACEIFLLTGDLDLVYKYYFDPEIYFKFERVL